MEKKVKEELGPWHLEVVGCHWLFGDAFEVMGCPIFEAGLCLFKISKFIS